MNDSTRKLLADAATRGANYLESLETRPVFPREADVERLRDALRGDMPAGRRPTPPDSPCRTTRSLQTLSVEPTGWGAGPG